MTAQRERFLCRLVFLTFMAICLLSPRAFTREKEPLPGGALHIVDAEGRSTGACPLEITDVDVTITGFFARVKVKQVFRNPLSAKIEAVYVFPLSQNAAVDDMVMVVGDRCVRSRIARRDEARRVYEKAKAAGHVAGLLDQERPNIFTQSVANIEPGAEVSICISYVETLKYEEGIYEFVFPMVVEPRYMPGCERGKIDTGWSKDTCLVPDASRISPPLARSGRRAGHDISLTVVIDTALSLFDLASVLHDVTITHQGQGLATVSLREKTEIPNRDFVLHYSLAGEEVGDRVEVGDAFFLHEDERGRFFTLILQPPRRYAPMEQVPRELIFVLDTSGSMRGQPIEKAKETMSRALDAMRPGDTFNMIQFAGGTSVLWEEPRPNTPENRAEAQDFLMRQKGRGGTEMMAAIEAALRRKGEPNTIGCRNTLLDRADERGVPRPIRIVCFMTDGCVGNDFAIIDAVKKNAGTTRVFSFGVGNSPNRFLLDGMAYAGRGEVEYVTLNSYAGAAVKRFCERIAAPFLTDISIDWGGLPVDDVYPQRIPDLFGARPVVVHGRLKGHAEAAITLRGNTGSGPFARRIRIDSRRALRTNDALPSLWAREKVRFLSNQDLVGLKKGRFCSELTEAITAVGLAYRLLTPFTSFVAVEERTTTEGGRPVTVPVPVELPDGVSREGLFGPGGSTGSSMGGGPCGGQGGGFMTGRCAGGRSGPWGPRGASTGGMGRRRYSGGMGYERWEFWWEHNKDALLPGRSHADEARAERTRRGILPSLTGAFKVDDPDILDSALLAVARVTPGGEASFVLDAIKGQLGSRYDTVRQSAALSLGVLGSPEAARVCRDLAADNEAGRKLTGGGKVPRLVRAFAALSLGLIGSEDANPLLRQLIERSDRKEQRDLIACAILSLGLIGDGGIEGEPTGGRLIAGAAKVTGTTQTTGSGNLFFLLDLLENSRIESLLRSYVPIALCKLGNRAAIGPLAALFGKEGLNLWVSQSCAIALGGLATPADQKVVSLLMERARNGRDQTTRHFCFIALAQIGARDGDFDRHREQHRKIATFFSREIARPGKTQHLSWASLAAAIHARKHLSLKDPLIARLSLRFSSVKDPSAKGAIAISLGLLDAGSATEMLFTALKSSRNKALQGHICVALGLMKWRKAAATIRGFAETSKVFRLRLQAAAALGMMGDSGATGVLVAALENGQTLSVCASAAKALGLIGDVRAIPSLLGLLDDPKANPIARAFAAVALGRIGEKTGRSWSGTLLGGINYRAKVDAISEVLDIL
jgi:Ca-activated chloride channel homolog